MLVGMPDVTRIMSAIEAGDPTAADQLLPAVYAELRRLAAHRLARESPGQTLQATALVHEAYLRLVGDPAGAGAPAWNSRGHFFAAAAEAMRRILIERARHKQTRKAGGGRRRRDLTDIALAAPDGPNVELLDLDAALKKLERLDRRKADLVKLRFFAGLTIEQAARALGIATSTADDDWAHARCWLRLEMEGGHE
jgi:RNA polymerase sigma factor (TIGR02999 family)